MSLGKVEVSKQITLLFFFINSSSDCLEIVYLLSNIYTFLSLIILGIEARAYDFPDTRPPHKNCTLYLSISGSNEFNITDLCIKNPGKCIRWFCLSNNFFPK